MATIPLQEPVYHGKPGPLFFAAGFRPFFLFAGIQAAVMLPLWLLVYTGALSLNLAVAANVWHGHEMVFGFAGAAVGGFLLTAVPNWTNTPHASGTPLMVLFAAWALGRLAFTLGGMLPYWLVAVLDLAYVPLLAAMLAGPLLKAGKWRNIAFLPILTLFFLANLLVHVGPDPIEGVYLGIILLLMMISIVGGRIVPSFTQNWLRMQGRPVEVRAVGWIEQGGAVASLAAGGLLATFLPTSPAAGALLLVAAAIHLMRLSRWHGLSILSSPILWVLHVGYLWLAVGLALWGISSFVPAFPASAALHALTAGCIGTMILGVMTRAALGHSGRPLKISNAIIVAYGLVTIGALLRVAAPLMPNAQLPLTHAGGTLWALAWLIFVVVYLPIVTQPRADGRPG